MKNQLFKPNKMKNKEIIGYKLKEKRYLNAVECIIDERWNPDTENIISYTGSYYEDLKEAGVLDIWFTPVYKEEPKPEIGKWYKHNDDMIFYCTDIGSEGHLYGYGIFKDEWKVYEKENSIFCACNSVAATEVKEATKKEVEEALIAEAKKRGFHKECSFKIANGDKIISVSDLFRIGYDNYGNKLLRNNWCIFEHGRWAEIISEEKPTKEELLNQLEQLKVKINQL